MHFLDAITITIAGLMVGNELAVSAFFNPAVWQLEAGPQAQGLSLLRVPWVGRCPFGMACVWHCSPWSRSCIAISLP